MGVSNNLWQKFSEKHVSKKAPWYHSMELRQDGENPQTKTWSVVAVATMQPMA